MAGSSLTGFQFIQERSEATPGLWNVIFSQLSENIAEANNISNLSSNISTLGMLTLHANSTTTNYLFLDDTSNLRSNYIIGSQVGGTADGLNIWDDSGQTMIVSFSKQSIRFYQNVVGPVFDVGGALADTYNAGTFGTGAQSSESRIQAAILQASIDGVSRVYVPANMYPYSASSMSFINTVQMVREGGDWGVYDIQAYGANPSNTGSATSAIQAAINAAADAGGQTIYFPQGDYRIAAKISISTGKSLALVGAGKGAAKLRNVITGAGADPLLEISSPNNDFLVEGLRFTGNALSGVGGNGNAISLINPNGLASGTFWPQEVMIRDCIIEYHNGTGKNISGTAIPACGIYMAAGTGEFVQGTSIYSCRMGFRAQAASKVYFMQSAIDACHHACVFVADSSEGIGFMNTILNGSGSGGSQDGLLYARESRTVTFMGGRLKNGNPMLVNLASDGDWTPVHSAVITGNSCEQLDSGSGHTAIGMNNASRGCLVSANDFLFVNTITDGIGIDVVQSAGGYENTGLCILGNTFDCGNGGTIAVGVRLNVTTNRVLSPIIDGNVFGGYTGSARTITSAIELRGICDGATIRNNVFAACVSGMTITNAIHLQSSTVTNTLIEQNSFRSFSGGTITTPILNTGAVRFTMIGNQQMAVPDGNQLLPGMTFSSESSLGWRRSGSSIMELSYGKLRLLAGVGRVERHTGDEFWKDGTPSRAGFVGLYNPISSGVDNDLGFYLYNGSSWGTVGRFSSISSQFQVGDGAAISPTLGFISETSLGLFRSGNSTIRQSYGTFWVNGGAVWAGSGISIGNATAGGTLIPAISSTSSLVAAFVVQPSASSFTVITWAAAQPGDQILTTVMQSGAVSSLSSGLVLHSHCTQAGQIEFRLSNVSTLAQNQSSRTYFFTRVTPF